MPLVALVAVGCAMALGVSGDLVGADAVVDSPLLIEGRLEWANESVLITTEVRIGSGGVLYIDSCNVTFDTERVLGSGITVEPNGTMSVGCHGGGCLFQRGERNNSYFIRGYQGSKVAMSNSTFIGMGVQPRSASIWESGMCLRSVDPTIIGCSFIDCDTALGLEAAGMAVVRECSFVRCYRGIWSKQTRVVRISNSTFLDCRTGVDGDRTGFSDADTIELVGCSFRGVYRDGVSFQGTFLRIKGCCFEEGEGGVLTSAQDAYVSDTSFLGVDEGVFLYGAGNCTLSNLSITNSSTALSVLGSTVMIHGCRVSSCHVFLGIESSRASVHRTIVESCAIGVNVLGVDPWRGPMGPVAVVDSRFVGVPAPLVCVDGDSVEATGCRFETSDVSLTVNSTKSVVLSENVFASSSVTASFNCVPYMNMDREVFDCLSLSLNLASSHMGSFNPVAVPPSMTLRLDEDSQFWSFIGPEDFSFEFKDARSEFHWVRSLSLRVLRASDGLPAAGCIVALSYPLTGPFVEFVVGFHVPVDVGLVRLMDLNSSAEHTRTPISVTMSLLPTVQTEYIDLSGEAGAEVLRTIVLDDLPPEIIISSPSDGQGYHGDAVEFIGHALDQNGTVAWTRLVLDVAQLPEVRDAWNFTQGLDEGWHTLIVVSSDEHNNTETVQIWFCIRARMPEILIDRPLNGTLTNRTTVEVEGRVENASWVRIGASWAVIDAGGRFSGVVTLVEGVNLLRIVYGSGTSSSEVVINIQLDTTDPGLALDPITSPTKRSSVILSGRVIDENPTEAIDLDGRTVTLDGNRAFSMEVVLEEGENRFVLTVQDSAGNVNRTELCIIADWHCSIELVNDVPPQLYDPTVVLDVIVEEGAILSVFIDSKSPTTHVMVGSRIRIPIDLERTGAHKILLEAEDACGNVDGMTIDVDRVDRKVQSSEMPVSLIACILIILVAVPIITLVLRSYVARRG